MQSPTDQNAINDEYGTGWHSLYSEELPTKVGLPVSSHDTWLLCTQTAVSINSDSSYASSHLMSRPSQLTSSLGSLGSLAPMKTNYKVHTALFPEGSQRETSPHDVLQKYFSPGSKPLRSLRGGKRTEKICINCELQKYLKPEVKVDACNTRLKQEDPKVQTQPGQLNNT